MSLDNDKPQDIRDFGFDPMREDTAQNPYELYHQMQAECPINRASGHGGYWVVSNYDAVNQAAGDYRTFSSWPSCAIPPAPVSPLYPIDIDPPLQTAFRKILNPRFTEAAVEQWREPFRKIVNEMIDGFVQEGEVHLARDLCQVAPLDIVLPLIGVPREDVGKLKPWVEALVRYRGELEISVPAGENLQKYMMELAARRRAMPEQDDVLGDLLKATVQGKMLTDEDIYRTLSIVLFGGLDTTTAAMLEGAKFLAENPEARVQLQADPSLWPNALEEIIRYTSPAQGMSRTIRKDTVLNGVELKNEERIMLLFGAANHDPEYFPNPETIDIERCPVKPHMAFGFGAHICLGRNLARVEVRTLLEVLFERIPDLRLKPGFTPEYHVSEARSMKELVCIFTPQK